MMTRAIGIKTTYIIWENETTATKTSQNFDSSHSDASEVRVGLPIGVEPVKPKPGDEGYSGMHDQGPLSELKEGGPVAFLIGCTKLAKDHNDRFLTECIDNEKKAKEQHSAVVAESTTQLESPGTVAKKSSALPNKRPKQ